MKRIILLLFIISGISIFFASSLNAQTTEKKLNQVVIKKTVVERSQMKQVPVVKKSEVVPQNMESTQTTDKTSTNSTNSQNNMEVKKCQTTITPADCSKKCTTPCHQKGTNTSTEKKPIPKF